MDGRLEKACAFGTESNHVKKACFLLTESAMSMQIHMMCFYWNEES